MRSVAAEGRWNASVSRALVELTEGQQCSSRSRRFTIMDHDVLKSYRGIQNIIFRVSGINTTTTLEGERIKNSVLLNSHIDSALPSKGSSE